MFCSSDLKELFTLADDNEGVDQDLPADGEVEISTDDVEEDHNTVPNTGRRSSGNLLEPVDSEKEKEKQLLRALWDGDAITGVYDHSSVEPGEESSIGNGFVAQTVVNSVRQLRASVESHPSSLGPLSQGRPEAQTSQQSTGSGAVSSSAMLRRLRECTGSSSSATPSMPGSSNSSSSIPNAVRVPADDVAAHINAPVPTTPEASMIPRLLYILNSGEELTSQQILLRFGHLNDHYAALFRETLRRLADFRNGVWIKRQTPIVI